MNLLNAFENFVSNTATILIKFGGIARWTNTKASSMSNQANGKTLNNASAFGKGQAWIGWK